MYFPKNSALVLFIDLNAIAASNTIDYGKTKRLFYVRAAEYMEISYLTNKRVKNAKKPAISDQLLTCNCNMNLMYHYSFLFKDSSNCKSGNSILNKAVKLFALELFE